MFIEELLDRSIVLDGELVIWPALHCLLQCTVCSLSQQHLASQDVWDCCEGFDFLLSFQCSWVAVVLGRAMQNLAGGKHQYECGEEIIAWSPLAKLSRAGWGRIEQYCLSRNEECVCMVSGAGWPLLCDIFQFWIEISSLCINCFVYTCPISK